MSDEQTKVCTKCGVEKGLGEFYNINAHPLSIASRCKKCCEIYARNRWLESRACKNNYRAIKLGVKGWHDATDIEELYQSQNGKCWYCGTEVEDRFQVDHFIPLDRGGSNWVSNLRIACPTCNLSKGAKDPHEWSGRLL